MLQPLRRRLLWGFVRVVMLTMLALHLLRDNVLDLVQGLLALSKVDGVRAAFLD